MYKKSLFAILTLAFLAGNLFSIKAFAGGEKANIDKSTMEKVKSILINKYGEDAKFRIERGVQQAGSLWRDTDGSAEDFQTFCVDNFVNDEVALDRLYTKLEHSFEIF
ncbi:MAG: hypothetical protein ACM3PX_10080, partial [Omnitrophica WOR_2 bacterium]